LGKTSQLAYMNNRLKQLEKLLLDNILLKMHNKTLVEKNPRWKEWSEMMQEITKKNIQKINFIFGKRKVWTLLM